jgi:hypothetical protein
MSCNKEDVEYFSTVEGWQSLASKNIPAEVFQNHFRFWK